MKKLYGNALGLWFLMCIIAVINGTIRNATYSLILGAQIAHIISSITCIFTLLGLIGWFYNKIGDVYENKDTIYIGILWLSMTVIFEFLFGHYIIGHSWDALLSDYDLSQGRIWLFVLITPFISSILWGQYFLNKMSIKNDNQKR
ncbi:MAG: hypothetical protein ACTSR8_10380 [Promethearchaeota archaeon]